MTRACQQLRRTLALVRFLEPLTYRPSLDALASRFRVTTRTMRRDLDVLREAGERVPPLRALASDDAVVVKAHRRYDESPLSRQAVL